MPAEEINLKKRAREEPNVSKDGAAAASAVAPSSLPPPISREEPESHNKRQRRSPVGVSPDEKLTPLPPQQQHHAEEPASASSVVPQQQQQQPEGDSHAVATQISFDNASPSPTKVIQNPAEATTTSEPAPCTCQDCVDVQKFYWESDIIEYQCSK